MWKHSFSTQQALPGLFSRERRRPKSESRNPTRYSPLSRLIVITRTVPLIRHKRFEVACIKPDYLRAWCMPFDCPEETGFAGRRNKQISLSDYKDAVVCYSREVLRRMTAQQGLRIIPEPKSFFHRAAFNEARRRALPDRQISAIRRSDRAKAGTNPIGEIGRGVSTDAKAYNHRVLARCALVSQKPFSIRHQAEHCSDTKARLGTDDGRGASRSMRENRAA